MTVIDKIRRACDLSKAGNYEEALACLSDAQNSDPWNGYLIDLTWRVATMYDLSQENTLSEREREEFIKWLPGILERIESSNVARPIFQRSGGKPFSRTAPGFSPRELSPRDTAKSPASTPTVPENGINKKPTPNRDADAHPGELSQVDYELFLLKRLEEQRKLTSLPSPTQEPPGRDQDGTLVDVPSFSEEEWKSDTENVPGKLEYGVRPANRLGGKFGTGSRTFLVIGAVVVPLLVASGVYYFLLRSDTRNFAPQPLPGKIQQLPEHRRPEELPAELRVQPQKQESIPSEEFGLKEKKPIPAAPQALARRDRSTETRIVVRKPDVRTTSAPPRPTVKPVTPPPTPSPAVETPVVAKTVPATVDSTRLRPVPTVEPPPRTGPNKVTLRVFINSTGRPTRAEVISSTDPSYNDPSIEEVMKSNYPPGEERTIVLGFVYP